MAKKDAQQHKSMDKRIIDSLHEGPIAALYYVVAINLLNETVSEMTDEQIEKMFEQFFTADRIRSNIKTIHQHLNP